MSFIVRYEAFSFRFITSTKSYNTFFTFSSPTNSFKSLNISSSVFFSSILGSSLLNDMYEKINNLVKKGGWESKNERGSANVYLAKVLKDKQDMLSLSSSISFLGELIINYADKVAKIVDDKVE